jgi:polynucleotide 5'-hydroxyl-kinase GRC3/NOL9
LILNMDGWVKGIGYQVLTALITNLEPSHVCQILGETKGKIFDLSHVINPDATTLFFLDACTKHVATPVSIPPSTLRTLRLGTYFGPHLVELWDTLDFLPAKRLQTGWVDPECTLARYLARERPYCVPFDAVQYYFLGADRQDLHSEEERILQALNGSIVALCTSTKNSEAATSTDCLGLGLVRSIDWRRRLFFLLTPVPPTYLPRVTALVGGNLPLPVPFVFRGVAAESFPYLSMKVVESDGALGTEPMKSRNNIARRGNIAGPPNGK